MYLIAKDTVFALEIVVLNSTTVGTSTVVKRTNFGKYSKPESFHFHWLYTSLARKEFLPVILALANRAACSTFIARL